jgi:hypothetical protein
MEGSVGCFRRRAERFEETNPGRCLLALESHRLDSRLWRRRPKPGLAGPRSSIRADAVGILEAARSRAHTLLDFP